MKGPECEGLLAENAEMRINSMLKRDSGTGNAQWANGNVPLRICHYENGSFSAIITVNG